MIGECIQFIPSDRTWSFQETEEHQLIHLKTAGEIKRLF